MFKRMLFCAGFICCIFGTVNAQIVDLEDLTLFPDSFWNGSDASGGFTSGLYAHFPNNYVDYGGGFTAWDGFSYSNKVNDTTQDFSNMYSCFAGQMHSGSTVFGVSFNSMNFSDYSIIPTEISFNVPAIPQSILITNSTYSALTIKNGDMFCKAFGGITGNDPDWFRLDIVGINNNIVTDTIHFYLADYRFTNNAQDYIVKDWLNVDLSALGQVTKIAFSLSSTDIGTYGLNTPAYFCFDNLSCNFLNNVSENFFQADLLFPNPSNGKVYSVNKISEIKVLSIAGEEVYYNKGNLKSFDLSEILAGIYIIKIKSEGKEVIQKLILK